MKIYADSHCTDKQLQVGEHVLLKLQPYTQQFVISRPFPELAYEYFGPFSHIITNQV
jgi:hypothetical protein